jgi:hypothetical protein
MSDSDTMPGPGERGHERQHPHFWKQTFTALAVEAITASGEGNHELALCLADEIRGVASRLMTTAVGNARRDGRSWAQIGRAAGLSKQAAWEKWRRIDARSRSPLQSALGQPRLGVASDRGVQVDA